MRSGIPLVARRALLFGLALGLVAPTLPIVASTVPVVAAQEPEPIEVSGAFEVSGDAAGADTFYRWELPQSADAWQLDIVGPADERVVLELLTEDLERFDNTSGTGSASFYDLGLAPGIYVLKVPRSPRETLPFTLAASAEDADFDPEPNDDVTEAVSMAVGDELAGRLAETDGDTDHFRLRVEAPSDALIDIALESTADASRNICLLDEDGTDRACRSGEGALQLTDLRLDPGEHVLRVRGSVRPDQPYRLRAAEVREATPDYEAEPNDDPAMASPLDVELGVSGRSDRPDPDFHAVTIEGEPQLWRWEASGPDIDRFALVNAGGVELQAAVAGRDGGPATIDDLLLGPGTHLFRIRTLGGPYRIEATPLGVPDADAEREPNSDPLRAEPYRVGERRTGRLATSDDVDFMRFTLAAPEHLTFRLQQAADSDIDVQLETGNSRLLRRWAAEPGASLEMDLRLEPGDYLLRLAPRATSPDPYELVIERADPFVAIADHEPNDIPAFASAVPPELRWTSERASGSDTDWYRLPELTAASDVLVTIGPEDRRVRFHAGRDADERVDLEKLDPGVYRATSVPAAVPLFLEIESGQPYDVQLEAAGWSPGPLGPAPAVDVSLRLDTEAVSAYWPEAQSVTGTLALTNAGSEAVTLDLEAVTSHFAWEATVAEGAVTLEPGATQELAVRLDIAPDVWADEPVRVTAAAGVAGAAPVTAHSLITATTEAPAVAPRLAWTVPDALRGGLNVASTALGGVPGGTTNLDRELFLYDGVTPTGGGFGFSLDEFPAELIVDLAGEAPVPVAGTIINPLARGSNLDELPHEFELLLSTDGATWSSVLGGVVSPLPIDQAFVLDEPVPATHAMLRVHSLRTGRSRTLALGEWKVVAEPGAVPDDMGSNIADPVRGGRVVREVPLTGSFDYQTEILDGDPKLRSRSTDREAPRFEAIIGFQDGRAAQVESLRWVDPDDTDPEERLNGVTVELSTESLLGPWQPVADWELVRDVSGAVAELRLDEPRWARYVRLSTDLPEGTRGMEAPAAIEIHERATDDEYRSILGEWGYTSRLGPYEALVPPAATSELLGPDAGDTRELATPLPFDAVRVDSAEILEDTDWYRIDVPSGDNTLTVDLGGVPGIGVGLTLFDAAGAELPAEVTAQPGGTLSHEWIVEPGAAYDLRVEQPPFNVVFTFDTSGSMGPFLQTVMEGLREFAADVKPGREAALIVPFEEQPLLEEWEDRPEVLVDAVNNFDPRLGSSSGAVISLLNATEHLADRDGARAVLIVTDAETGGLALVEDVWQSFDRVRPVVYSVHIGASGRPVGTRNLMQSWAHANGGHYSYPTTHGEMDREFERMSTQLRRPATYSLLASTAAVNRDPASLSVVAPVGRPPALAPGVGVAIILDTSGSMNERLDGEKRLDIAKASMRELVNERLVEGVPVSLRIFGKKGKSKAARCSSRLALPLQPLDRARTLKLVKKLDAPRKTRTPIADSLYAIPGDLAEVTGTRLVVLITDGEESCGGDPSAAIAELRASGTDVNLNIVGLALDDAALKEEMAGWAAQADGSYFDAANAAELGAALAAAFSAPFEVFEPDGGELIARSTVGGEAVVLDPGTYRIEVLSDPPVTFEGVRLDGGASVSLELPAPAGEP